MRILGIDPGLRITGYGCVDCPADGRVPCLIEAGALVFRSDTPVHSRLVELERDLDELLSRVSPDAVTVEKIFSHYAHPRTSIIMGHARGVILLAIARRGIQLLELPSTEVKKALTGNGHASKPQMQAAVMAALRLSEMPQPADVADALAIALCGAVRRAAAESGLG